MKLSELTFFIPAFNEVDNLRIVIPKVLKLLPKIASVYEFLVVLDMRSSDQSLIYLQEISSLYPEFRIIKQSHEHSGYGKALALGWEKARYSWVFYTDADQQYSLEDINLALNLTDQADFIAGFRKQRQDPIIRIMTSMVYNLLARTLLGFSYRDIDCSFKLIRKSMLEQMSFHCQTGALEAELFFQAEKMACSILQIPVRHFPRKIGTSTFDHGNLALPEFNNIKTVFKELIKLRKLKFRDALYFKKQ